MVGDVKHRSTFLSGTGVSVIIGAIFWLITFFSGDSLGLSFGDKLLTFFLGLVFIILGLVFDRR